VIVAPKVERWSLEFRKSVSLLALFKVDAKSD